ncbi:hypothetical protein [Phaeovulum sp. W22_SRMD_FR3]|uniref:hypothetical protein n=1 Tax=Phaeovulum sp. W22_SRMD_FR3 TaxID=3240274 RepID=UPI003F9B9BCB
MRADPPQPTATGRLLSAAQITALGKTLDSATPQHRDAADTIRLIPLTGCRSGEILQLGRSEVLADKLALETTKTGPRTVHLAVSP